MDRLTYISNIKNILATYFRKIGIESEYISPEVVNTAVCEIGIEDLTSEEIVFLSDNL